MDRGEDVETCLFISRISKTLVINFQAWVGRMAAASMRIFPTWCTGRGEGEVGEDEKEGEDWENEEEEGNEEEEREAGEEREEGRRRKRGRGTKGRRLIACREE